MKLGVLLLWCGLFTVACKSSQHANYPVEDVAQQTGLDFFHSSGAMGEYLLPEITGSGGALFDYDNDGDLDVYLVQGTPTEAQNNGKLKVAVPPGWKPGNRLLRNNLARTGKLSFTDVTDAAGVGHRGMGMGVAAGDYDNDGYADLYVTNYGGNVLYHNNGNGTFTDVTATAGVASSGWSTSAGFIDFDRDGLLDLVVVHYVEFDPKPCYLPSGRRDYCGPQDFARTVTQVYRNMGNGRFEDATARVGLNAKRGPGLGILTGDFGANGWPSFMVANDGAANHLWLNEPRNAGSSNDRVFREAGLTQGLAYASDGRARAGMGLATGDIYGDGAESVVVTNLPNEAFTLFSRQPHGDFMDSTAQSGVLRPSLPYTGFGVGLIDIENRGLLDMFSANGAVLATPGARPDDPYPYGERNLLLRNLGKGKGFQDVTASAGPAFEHNEVGRAAIFGDVNNDGGVDILVANNNGPARLLLNTAPERGHWITVVLEGVKSNRSGYGSSVELIRKNGTAVKRWVRADGSYLASNDPRVHFGLGKSPDIERIKVRWPAGGCEWWNQSVADRIVTLREGAGMPCGVE
ncbi:MAG: CRTAC1 family protein [Bryobacterales bacterium]|nr:CRTAC1 family protein [Bryobacterales bacterium]